MAKRHKGASAKAKFWMMRGAPAHPRLLISAALAAITFAAMPGTMAIITRMLVGWDVGVVLYLGAAFTMMARATVTDISAHADAQDEGAVGLLFLTVAAAVASLGAIFIALATADQKAADYGLRVALAISTVV